MKTFNKLLSELVRDFPDVHFAKSEQFYWSPKNQTVYYADDQSKDIQNLWTLLHETAHSILKHTNFKSDFHLVKLEMEAWQKTEQLAQKYQITIPDSEYIQDCIDTYRNWRHQRSQCPSCQNCGIQINSKTYHCVKCRQNWEVSGQRFCRVYRTKV